MTGESPRPEQELVVTCLEPTFDDVAVARTVELVNEGIDWGLVYELAQWHQVRPLLLERLDRVRDSEGTAAPEAVMSRLRDDRLTITQRNLVADDQCLKLVERLTDRGVRVIPFKGPVLACQAYDDLTAREFLDVDLLVDRSDVTDAMDVLEAQGYEWEYDLPRLDDGVVLGSGFTEPLLPEYTIRHDQYPVSIELRWRVGEPAVPLDASFDQLWRSGHHEPIDGVDIRHLDPVDRLLVLAYHGTKHHWQRFKWLADIAWLLDGHAFDTIDVLERAREFDVERRLLVGLGVVTGIFEVEPPEGIHEQMQATDSIEVNVRRTINSLFEDPTPQFDKWELLRYNAAIRGAPAGGVTTIARKLLTPGMTDYERYPLPSRYHVLYYPSSPVRKAVDALSPSNDR